MVCLQLQRFSPLLEWHCAGRCGALTVAESYILHATGSLRHWAASEHRKLQIQPPQWHTSRNKATPTSTKPYLLIMTLLVRLRGPVTFKPLQVYNIISSCLTHLISPISLLLIWLFPFLFLQVSRRFPLRLSWLQIGTFHWTIPPDPSIGVF